MHRAFIFLSVFGLLSSLALGQFAPTSQPASNSSVAPLPKPVLVLPFVSPGDAKYKELGRDIQQTLANGISADLRGHVNAPASAKVPADAPAALAAANESNSSAVVFGRAQVNADQVHFSGQVLDVSSGRVLASLTESGPIDGLFRLEDDLTQQVVAGLPEGLLNLHGLLSSRPRIRPQTIYLPSDAPVPSDSQRLNGSYAGPIASYTLPPPPGGSPPYSPNAGSYPYRFTWPYAHLFSYDYDPDPFLPLPIPIYGGIHNPERFTQPRVDHSPVGPEQGHEAPGRR